jgi:hypothetical protein
MHIRNACEVDTMAVPSRHDDARRVAVTFRIRPEIAQLLRERSKARGMSQTAFVEGAIEAEWKSERRRLAQEAAILDAEVNERLAEESVAVAREVLGEPP